MNAVGSATKPAAVIQPVKGLDEGITLQQKVLTSYQPKSEDEVAAKQTQLSLLDGAQERQVDYEEATLRVNGLSPARRIAGAQLADQTDAVNSLCTDGNRQAIVNAVKYAVDMWRLMAHFSNLQIMGQLAIGMPGCLQGPEMRTWILEAPGVYNAQGHFNTLLTAVADGVSGNFRQWADSVSVPDLPWYPMFVAVPAPFAPPTPNIPMSLMVCVSQHFSKLASPSEIEAAIRPNLSEPFSTPEMDMFIFALSAHLANYFVNWLSAQQVMMVMGMGPVPTFNPPHVPVGPVVNGYVIPSPGHLAA